MNLFNKIMYGSFSILFMIIVIPLIFNFLNISFASYSIYLAWFIVLIILFLFLPQEFPGFFK